MFLVSNVNFFANAMEAIRKSNVGMRILITLIASKSEAAA